MIRDSRYVSPTDFSKLTILACMSSGVTPIND